MSMLFTVYIHVYLGSSVHADILRLMAPAVVLLRAARDLRRVAGMGRDMSRMCGGGLPGEHPELEAQVEVTHALEHTAELEGPGNGLGAVEEVTHLHGVTENPGRDDRHTEALA